MRNIRPWLFAVVILAPGSSVAGQAGAAVPADARPADRDAQAANPIATQLQFGVAYEDLSNGYAPWRSATLDLRTTRPSGGVRASVEETMRFSQLDHSFTLGFERRLTARWRVSGEAHSSPSHHFSAAWGALAQVELAPGGGWGVQGNLHHVRYSSTSIDLSSVTVERYLSRYRVAYSLYAARLQNGEMSMSHRALADVYYGSLSSSLGMSMSTGEEIESVVPLGVLRTPVRAAAVVGRQWFRPSWFVTYDALVHEQGHLYTRRRFSLGLGHRF